MDAEAINQQADPIAPEGVIYSLHHLTAVAQIGTKPIDVFGASSRHCSLRQPMLNEVAMRNRPPSRQARTILEALVARPLDWQYGYELCKRVGLSSGTLYPVLIRLHDRGLLEAKWVEAERPGRPARHAYRLTPEGVAFVKALNETLEPRASSGDEVLA